MPRRGPGPYGEHDLAPSPHTTPAHLNPITGEVILGSQATTRRYERQHPGELIHVDVKKIGKISDDGGWRLHGRAATSAERNKRERIGYDYVHAAVDDHSRLAYVEIHDVEKGSTCAAFLTRGAASSPARASVVSIG